MQLPSKIIDISMPLDNESVCDPEIMRPKIEYVSQQENAEAMVSFFDGMKTSELPSAEGLYCNREARELVLVEYGPLLPFGSDLLESLFVEMRDPDPVM